MNDFFEGTVFPFLKPLAYRISGADAYFPIPYRHACKIVLKENTPLYYHFGYKTYPEDTVLETYSAAGAEAAREALEVTLERLGHPGPGMADRIYPDGLEEVSLRATALPGERSVLFTRNGSGCFALLEILGTSLERHQLRNALLRIYGDGEERPAVNCPLGDFFGTSFGQNLFRALPMGMTEEGGYCLFPMPFEEGARIELLNQGKQPLEVSGRVLLCTLPTDDPLLRFHAGWRRENPCQVFDYPILDVKGSGKFVGCALYIDNPRSRWWGEGDEKIYVDGEEFPSTYGTGSED